jgi:DNA-binding NarL/FixJ family response regulator
MEHVQVVERTITRVLIADTTLIQTQLLVEALRRDRNLEVFTAYPDVKSLVAASNEHNIDVLLISANLGEHGNRGLEVLREVCAARTNIRPIVLIDSSRVELVLDAFRAGARGVISRIQSVKTLSKSIRCVQQGQIWASRQEMSLALEALASSQQVHALDPKSLNLLSKRETEIVKLLAAGLTNREIAERLKISQHTVKNYVFRVFDKVGASNRIELLLMTLSQNKASEPVADPVLKNFMDVDLEDAAVLAKCQRGAECGQLSAQLALAQFLWSRNDLTDIEEAYKWCLIASSQIQEMSNAVSRAMTMEQLVQAEQIAADWLRKARKIPASSVTEIQHPREEGGRDAAPRSGPGERYRATPHTKKTNYPNLFLQA